MDGRFRKLDRDSLHSIQLPTKLWMPVHLMEWIELMNSRSLARINWRLRLRWDLVLFKVQMVNYTVLTPILMLPITMFLKLVFLQVKSISSELNLRRTRLKTFERVMRG